MTASPTSPVRTVGVLGNANHMILRLTLQKLLAAGTVPTFVLEDLGSPAMVRKTGWYQECWEKTTPVDTEPFPTVAEMLAPHPGVAHYTVDDCNSEEACALMSRHTSELFLLANTRVVKPYIRGSLPFLFAILDNAPLGITLHHVLPALDAGDMLSTCSIPIKRGDTVADMIRSAAIATAELMLQGVVDWDGTTNGVKQDESMLLERNRKCHLAPRTKELFSEFCAKADAFLESRQYRWYDRAVTPE
ncbi:hypothetical protein TeGR_g2188 [Tetraparma gracilis]|uniref:Methionyl-tRNA formyltransferase n=1 Tax=Tetraparma gracilis TaxID=2962635 RepID=A0ABQ6N7N9_9STRA|nr:hypothetical protein TeGR_g2188 [Tetraparma gracilis]